MKGLDEWIEDNVNIYAIDSVKDIKDVLISFIDDFGGMFSSEQMKQAYLDGVESEQKRCGYFDIEKYIE